ncbi:hypothetical protein CEXT_573301 [Caerostris extrusa]|uniref:Uncharacterized protein n=1 Tax=Caerostris extrusa TaxID=172846 RepID=A0AAV4RHW1_CAEEX|nr:hypothetical protein CEXT_573301 [Caerostris extrusa]
MEHGVLIDTREGRLPSLRAIIALSLGACYYFMGCCKKKEKDLFSAWLPILFTPRFLIIPRTTNIGKKNSTPKNNSCLYSSFPRTELLLCSKGEVKWNDTMEARNHVTWSRACSTHSRGKTSLLSE